MCTAWNIREILLLILAKGIKNGCPWNVGIRGTQGNALVGEPLASAGK